MGRKDIIKVEGPIDNIDLDVLGYIDHNITVNVIRDNKITEKSAEAAEKDHQRDPLQESALHHLH